MRRSISRLTPYLALVPGFLPDSCAAAQDQTSGYSYEMVSLPTSGSSIDDPNRPYQELRDETNQKAELEALQNSSVENAYRGRTYFGGNSDSYMVYAITPERGVFYYLPPGPYPLDGNEMSALPDTIDACRLEVEWEKLEQYPYIERLRTLDFVSKDCEPFERQTGLPEEERPEQEFKLQESSGGKHSVYLVTSTKRSGLFDVVRALVQTAETDGKRISRTIPLAGINEDEILAGLTDDGSVYLLQESSRLRHNQRCVLSVADWSAASESRVRAESLDICDRLRDVA